MFGGDVMIADRHVIVGAELEGAAYVFKLPGNTVTITVTLELPILIVRSFIL